MKNRFFQPSPELLLAGETAKELFNILCPMVNSGNRPSDLEKKARDFFGDSKMKSAFLGYKGYPAAICVSVNSTIVHGIPDDLPFQDGDVVSIDLGVSNNGHMVDAARTLGVGQLNPINERLIATAELALAKAIKLVRPGLPVNELGRIIEEVVRTNGFFVVKELTGHGIGKQLQEPPSIYNYYRKNPDDLLTTGQTIAIEPIITLSPTSIQLASDGWTISAKSDTVAAHAEDSVTVTETGHTVLTRANQLDL